MGSKQPARASEMRSKTRWSAALLWPTQKCTCTIRYR